MLFLFNYLISLDVTYQDATKLVCIAFEESTLKPNAIHKNSNNTRDYGLFQINDVWLHECKETPQTLLKTETNVKCALKLYKEQGPEIWSTYRRCK